MQGDTAWDHDRVAYETQVLKGTIEADPGRPVPWDEWLDHPYVRYHANMARADLGTVTEYLDEEKVPVRFLLNRLPLVTWTQVRTRLERSTPEAHIMAIRHGLNGVEGADLELASPLTEVDLQRLRKLVGDDGLDELGRQIICASRELLDHEKKP